MLSHHITVAYGSTSETYSSEVSNGYASDYPDAHAGFGAQFGYYTDTETNLILCTFRYYDLNTGRWINRGPIRFEGDDKRSS